MAAEKDRSDFDVHMFFLKCGATKTPTPAEMPE